MGGRIVENTKEDNERASESTPVTQRGCGERSRRGGVLGSWFLVLGSWFLVLGSWFLVLGSWFLVLGSWFLVLGSWFLVLGSWFSVLTVSEALRCGRSRPPHGCEISPGSLASARRARSQRAISSDLTQSNAPAALRSIGALTTQSCFPVSQNPGWKLLAEYADLSISTTYESELRGQSD